MIKVTIIGNGNVSHYLQKAFSKAEGIQLLGILPSRSDPFDQNLSNAKNQRLENDADIYLIAVSDDAISSVSHYFRHTGKLVLHTSGSTDINALPKTVRQGVFYPLQTFSKNREVNFSTVPICIEATATTDLELLKNLAGSISNAVYELDSKQRKKIHLAAVFVNNFSNHLYYIANEICDENALSFDLLKPLISETAAKIETLAPKNAQTGPAKRNDTTTIQEQLKQLKTTKQKQIYTVLTESIKKTYGEEL